LDFTLIDELGALEKDEQTLEFFIEVYTKNISSEIIFNFNFNFKKTMI